MTQKQTPSLGDNLVEFMNSAVQQLIEDTHKKYIEDWYEWLFSTDPDSIMITTKNILEAESKDPNSVRYGKGTEHENE